MNELNNKHEKNKKSESYNYHLNQFQFTSNHSNLKETSQIEIKTILMKTSTRKTIII